MSKSKNEDNKKKKVGAATKSVAKNDQALAASIDRPSLTWIGISYQFYSIVRICKSVANYAHPAVFVHSAKDNIVLPVVKRHCPEETRNILEASVEIIEFLISPTRYILNIVSYTVAETTGKIVKQNYAINHPELRAGVDVVFNETAFHVVKKMSASTEKPFGRVGFFQKQFSAENLADKILSLPVRIRSKL